MAARWVSSCASSLGLDERCVLAASRLLEGEASHPFILRYRAHLTGPLLPSHLRAIGRAMEDSRAVEARRGVVLRLAERGGAGADVLRALSQAYSIDEIEDLYCPFKRAVRTKADRARERGLEAVAMRVWREELGDTELGRMLHPAGHAEGVLTLLAQVISELPQAREASRALFMREARLQVLPPLRPRQGGDEGGRDGDSGEAKGQGAWLHVEGVAASRLPAHTVLKLNREEKRNRARLKVVLPSERGIEALCEALPAPRRGKQALLLRAAAADAYKRLVQPAMGRYVRKQLTAKAEEAALRTFSRNLERLLLQKPLRGARILGVDPGFRSGCKLAAIDETGRVVHHSLIWALPPHNRRGEAEACLVGILREHAVSVVAIGNGTGGREVMEVVAGVVRGNGDLSHVRLCVVSEAGASVLSVSAACEGLDSGVEGAASIARRLQDPLGELVRVDPRSIGVGMYQHDVDQKKLEGEVSCVVEGCVCEVGVDVNTGSEALLARVAGLNVARAKAIVSSRPPGGYTSRAQLLGVKGIGAKSYEQAAGFLRVCGEGATEPLDATAVHPESYVLARKMLQQVELRIEHVSQPSTRQAIRKALSSKGRISQMASELGVPEETAKQVAEALMSDCRDPRESGDGPLLLGSQLRDIAQLKVGQLLHGVVRNVTPFGGFVDVGLKEDGLIHISELSEQRVHDPHELIEVGQPVVVMVISVDTSRDRIGLSLKAAHSISQQPRAAPEHMSAEKAPNCKLDFPREGKRAREQERDGGLSQQQKRTARKRMDDRERRVLGSKAANTGRASDPITLD